MTPELSEEEGGRFWSSAEHHKPSLLPFQANHTQGQKQASQDAGCSLQAAPDLHLLNSRGEALGTGGSCADSWSPPQAGRARTVSGNKSLSPSASGMVSRQDDLLRAAP